MATYNNTTFQTHDDYMTPKKAWEAIAEYIPKDRVIWEAFYGNGASGRYLEELGHEVVHRPVDFYENDLGEVVVSNPPFSHVAKILERLREMEKPFILLMSTQKMFTRYFRQLFGNDPDIRLLVPRGRIQFDKVVDGKPVKTASACAFDCCYYCWRIPETLGLPTMHWL